MGIDHLSGSVINFMYPCPRWLARAFLLSGDGLAGGCWCWRPGSKKDPAIWSGAEVFGKYPHLAGTVAGTGGRGYVL